MMFHLTCVRIIIFRYFFFCFTICSLNILLIKILVIPFWFLGLTCFLIGSIHDLCIFFTSMLFLTKSDGRHIL